MKSLKIVALLLFVIHFNGCISEDCHTCPTEQNVALKFEYPNFPDHITRVNVGIFDQDGVFITSMQVNKSELDQFQGVILPLQPGKYTAVCWGNAFDQTQIKGFSAGSNINEGQVSSPNYGIGLPIATNDSLYYGKLQFEVLNSENQTYTVNFTPAYIRFIITIKGLSSIGQQDPENYPYIRINNLNPAYNFDMDTIGSYVSYYPKLSVNTTEKIASAKSDVLRFNATPPITIDIVRSKTSSDILTTLNLRKFIEDNDIEIIAGKEITLSLLFTFSNNDVDVNVTINQWGEIPIDPDI